MKDNSLRDVAKDINHNQTNRKVKRLKAKKIISTVLITAGFLIIIIPVAGRMINNKRQADMLENFYIEVNQGSTMEVYNEINTVLEWGSQEGNQENIDQAGQEIADLDNGSELQESGLLKAMPEIIGVISIDKIDLELPIGEGMDLDTLRFVIGHLPESAPLGTVGNSVLAGHRSHAFGTFFNRLDELEIGDEIKITNSSGLNYTYEVYETLLVSPDDISPMRGSSKHKVITLITCHPILNPDSRLIVHAVQKP